MGCLPFAGDPRTAATIVETASGACAREVRVDVTQPRPTVPRSGWFVTFRPICVTVCMRIEGLPGMGPGSEGGVQELIHVVLARRRRRRWTVTNTAAAMRMPPASRATMIPTQSRSRQSLTGSS